MDEDEDVVRPGRGLGCGVLGYDGWPDEGVGKSEVNSAAPQGAREGEPSIDTRGIQKGVGQVRGPVKVRCGGFLLGAGDDS